MTTQDASRSVALVTGGSRGIGLAICQRLAAADFDLAVVGRRNHAEVAETLETLRQPSTRVIYRQTDVADLDAHAALLQDIDATWGRLDVLVNNAGVAPQIRHDLLDATPESFDRLMRINLRGPYFLTQRVARWMIAQKKSNPDRHLAIVNISSISAGVASTNRGDYCMSKAGLSMASQLWAVRLGEFGIPVYEVRPGIIRTDMTAGVADHYDQLMEQGLTLEGRWGTPDDVGRAVAVLATGQLPYATGNVLCVDGGLVRARL